MIEHRDCRLLWEPPFPAPAHTGTPAVHVIVSQREYLATGIWHIPLWFCRAKESPCNTCYMSECMSE